MKTNLKNFFLSDLGGQIKQSFFLKARGNCFLKFLFLPLSILKKKNLVNKIPTSIIFTQKKFLFLLVFFYFDKIFPKKVFYERFVEIYRFGPGTRGRVCYPLCFLPVLFGAFGFFFFQFFTFLAGFKKGLCIRFLIEKRFQKM